MKKIFMICLLTLVVALTGCSTIDEGVTEVKLEGNDLYAYSSYSTAALLNGFTSPAVATNDVNFGLMANNEETDVETVLDDLNVYYDMLENFMASDKDNVFNIEEKESSNTDYQKELNFSFNTPNGTSQQYTMFYNEDEDGNLEGLMILGDSTYQLEGKRSVEDDEEKFELMSIDVNNENNWVKMVLKQEENEVKYKYEISNNGVVEETEIKIEDEDNEFKIKIKLESEDNENEFMFKRELNEDGNEEIKIKYEYNNEKGEIKVVKSQDENGNEVLEYKIKTGKGKERSVEKYKAIDDDDDDDNDDDDHDDNDDENEDNNDDDEL